MPNDMSVLDSCSHHDFMFVDPLVGFNIFTRFVNKDKSKVTVGRCQGLLCGALGDIYVVSYNFMAFSSDFGSWWNVQDGR